MTNTGFGPLYVYGQCRVQVVFDTKFFKKSGPRQLLFPSFFGYIYQLIQQHQVMLMEILNLQLERVH